MTNYAGKLGHSTIEYVGINIHDHYANGGVFTATKIIEKIILAYASTGSVIYSNKEFLNSFDNIGSARTLQIAFNLIEKYGIIKRTFLDPETKYQRTGFTVDINLAKKWLASTPEDVIDLPRGNLLKHFVHQSVILIKKTKNAIIRSLEIIKQIEDKEKRQALVQDVLNRKNKDYDRYISKMVKRHQKIMKKQASEFTEDEFIKAGLSILNELRYTPPPNTVII